jgi:hypothetical protein
MLLRELPLLFRAVYEAANEIAALASLASMNSFTLGRPCHFIMLLT